ncbi:hypothetical protein [Streptomyces xanthochromogenes]|uniref:hypothetical protein n=1 Tax=Streptomyces xanthochromogenes TaxID=67384 RepID=UPI0037F7BB23
MTDNVADIKLTGGSFNGRSRGVQLDQDGLPPARLRARGDQKQGVEPCLLAHLHTCYGPGHSRRLDL